MTDILNNAVSGLLAFQRALNTTSHNIANVNTAGYSRQVADIQTQPPSLVGGAWLGNGVRIESIQRNFDQFVTDSLRESTSSFNRLDRFHDLAAQIDNILADPVGGISPVLQEFFSAVQDVADDPASSAARFQMITVANTFAGRFNTFDTRLEQLNQNSAKDVEAVVNEINDLAVAIRDINIKLEEFNASGVLTQQSSDLLDKRDALIQELSSKVAIDVINDQANNITIQIGNGQTLVSGSSSFSLSVQPNIGDPTQDIIVYNGFNSVNDISTHLNGGELGGLLDFRNNVLNPSRNALGRLAIGLSQTFNAQHRSGMDLQGNLGGDLFSVTPPQTIPFSSNGGTSTITTTITDVNQLTTDNYQLNFDGANWTLISDSGTSSGAIADASPANTTLTFEGLTVVINGTSAPAAGDRFTIKPTFDGARTLSVLIDDSNQIAAAAPIRTSTSLNNLGDAQISAGVVTDATNVNLLNTVTFTFNTPATTFTSTADVVVGGVPFVAGAAIPFTQNMQVDANGWQVNLDGNPQAGDIMTIESNNGGLGDNRNMLLLANLQTVKNFGNGSSNYQEIYAVLVGEVGSFTHSAEIEKDAQQALLTQAEDRRNQKSGVNLDEEAADLIKYQQAYEAAARVITTVQTLFDSLINSLR